VATSVESCNVSSGDPGQLLWKSGDKDDRI